VTIRRRVCGPYLIFYLASNERIDVLRILHGAQDYESILFGEP
jgi:plasmid stabilization system protein ParE